MGGTWCLTPVCRNAPHLEVNAGAWFCLSGRADTEVFILEDKEPGGTNCDSRGKQCDVGGGAAVLAGLRI